MKQVIIVKDVYDICDEEYADRNFLGDFEYDFERDFDGITKVYKEFHYDLDGKPKSVIFKQRLTERGSGKRNIYSTFYIDLESGKVTNVIEDRETEEKKEMKYDIEI